MGKHNIKVLAKSYPESGSRALKLPVVVHLSNYRLLIASFGVQPSAKVSSNVSSCHQMMVGKPWSQIVGNAV